MNKNPKENKEAKVEKVEKVEKIKKNKVAKKKVKKNITNGIAFVNATFNNTIVALEESGDKLDRITSIFFNLNSADTNEEIQKIAFTISPKLSDLKNFILFNEILFNKVEIVFKKNIALLSIVGK